MSEFARIVSDGVIHDVLDKNGRSLTESGLLIESLEIKITAGGTASAVLHVPIIEVDVATENARIRRRRRDG